MNTQSISQQTPGQEVTINEIVAKLTAQVAEPNSYPAELFLPLVEAVQRKLGMPTALSNNSTPDAFARRIKLPGFAIVNEINSITTMGYGLKHIGKLIADAAGSEFDLDENKLQSLGIAVEAMGTSIAYNHTLEKLVSAFDSDEN